MTSPTTSSPASQGMKASSSSARPKRRPMCSAPRSAAGQTAVGIPGSFGRRRRSISTTSTSSTATSARCSSSSARTFRTRRRSVSMATSGSNASSPSGGSPMNRWTMGFGRPRNPPASNRSLRNSMRHGSTPWCANGFGACRIRSPRRIARPAIGISSRSSKPSSR